MALVQLTEVTHGDPHPWGVNPDHVATIRPRKTIIPIDAQQDPRGQITYEGTIVVLATGEQHFVTEDFDTVAGLLNPVSTPTPTAFTDTTSRGGVPLPDTIKPPTPAPIKKSHHKQPEKPAQDQESTPPPSALAADLKSRLLSSSASPAHE